MFPSIDLSLINTTENDEMQLSNNHVGRSFAFDYENKCFIFANGNNKDTTQVDAIKQWIELFIRTRSDKFAIYNSDFGVRLAGLLGYRLPRSYVLAEIKKRIVNGILNGCPAVVSVTDWVFSKGRFSFTVTTNTGEEVKIINDI